MNQRLLRILLLAAAAAAFVWADGYYDVSCPNGTQQAYFKMPRWLPGRLFP